MNYCCIAGNILSIQTVTFKIPELDWLDGYRINPKQCSCPDDFFTHTMSFIRVFYKFAQPAFQIIGTNHNHYSTLPFTKNFKISPFDPKSISVLV